MRLSKRLRSIEHARDGDAEPGMSIASRREASRALRDYPDLQLITRGDCDRGPEGDQVYAHVMLLRARARGTYAEARDIEEDERRRASAPGATPPMSAEELDRSMRYAALLARARIEVPRLHGTPRGGL